MQYIKLTVYGFFLIFFFIQKLFHDLCMHYQELYKNGGLQMILNLNIAYKIY